LTEYLPVGFLLSLLFKFREHVLLDLKLDLIKGVSRSKYGLNKNILVVHSMEKSDLRFLISNCDSWKTVLQGKINP
jgi:hypothetical protein